MINIESIKEQVRSDLHENSLPDTCLRIIDYVASTKPTQLAHITYNTLYKISKPHNEEALLLAIQYLTGSKIQLLESAYELFYDGFPIQIEKSHLAEAERDGVFAHPETGEVIDNYSSYIEIYFKLSDKITEAQPSHE